MAEPATSTGASGAALVAIAASLVGAKYGPLVSVATAGFVGAFISLGEVSTGGRLASLGYLLGYTAAASLTAGTLSYLIERYTHVPAIEILMLVALMVGWIGGRWQTLLGAVLNATQKLIASRGGAK